MGLSIPSRLASTSSAYGTQCPELVEGQSPGFDKLSLVGKPRPTGQGVPNKLGWMVENTVVEGQSVIVGIRMADFR
ncbi:MAG TPA: hypothetical protein DCP32_12490 [Anaerolineaceae bacterium]|nr:MAG: hypothetical protein A2X24_05150 [Chloroflexi bacterium GWB2_54_36]HAL17523.1 hypothetical protein [Anaerolineaceae bacterium]